MVANPASLYPSVPLIYSQPLVVSILSERRSFQPYGMAGGLPGERGLNLLTREMQQTSPALTACGVVAAAEAVSVEEEKRADSEVVVISLGGKNTVDVRPGDRLTIFSPGGGGYGAADVHSAYSGSRTSDAVGVKIGTEGCGDSPTGSSVSSVCAGTSSAVMSSGSLLQYSLNQESV